MECTREPAAFSFVHIFTGYRHKRVKKRQRASERKDERQRGAGRGAGGRTTLERNTADGWMHYYNEPLLRRHNGRLRIKNVPARRRRRRRLAESVTERKRRGLGVARGGRGGGWGGGSKLGENEKANGCVGYRSLPLASLARVKRFALESVKRVSRASFLILGFLHGGNHGMIAHPSRVSLLFFLSTFFFFVVFVFFFLRPRVARHALSVHPCHAQRNVTAGSSIIRSCLVIYRYSVFD